MDLSVITVTWNSGGYIADQIASVKNARKNISCEQIIVDNSSTDDTMRVVEANKYEALRLFKNSSNLGFSAANNIGARIAKGALLLFLNPDMRLAPESLDVWVRWMQNHPETGISGCKLTDENGKINENAGPRRFPTFWNQLAIFFKIPHIFPSILKNYLYYDLNLNLEQEVDSVRGSCLLMRRELYERLGRAFDPRYFIWFEDVDVCREARRLGLKVVYLPAVAGVDKVGRSFSQRGLVWKQWNFFKSAVKYFWKWR